MKIRLSPDTERCINVLFSKSQWDEVARLLLQECGNNLPLLDNFNEVELERVRFAALKLSGGNLKKLHDAIRLAKEDWRDLLVSVDFAEDLNAHRQWFSTSVNS